MHELHNYFFFFNKIFRTLLLYSICVYMSIGYIFSFRMHHPSTSRPKHICADNPYFNTRLWDSDKEEVINDNYD